MEIEMTLLIWYNYDKQQCTLFVPLSRERSKDKVVDLHRQGFNDEQSYYTVIL